MLPLSIVTLILLSLLALIHFAAFVVGNRRDQANALIGLTPMVLAIIVIAMGL